MKLSLFDYDLPETLIAQYPQRRRDKSNLLVLDRKSNTIRHRRFGDIISFLRPGDALVINNTKVFKARLIGKRESGAAVEILLVRKTDDHENWEALARPSRRLMEGEKILFDSERLELASDRGNGRWLVRFKSGAARRRIIARNGHVPLPQYVNREDAPSDVRRYQTVYADPTKTGAVAAPTAGFHFSKSLLEAIKQMGVEIVSLTLHVGPGTFRPVTKVNIDEVQLDSEMAELPLLSADRLNRVRCEGGRVFAVGTTSVRALESAELTEGRILPYSGPVDLFISPGYRFRIVDHLITNFHLPRSTLLMLVSAFAGRERILRAYKEAIRQEYRFYSYGDAMLIL